MKKAEPTITGVILTLNEEYNLPRALRSLSWCDHTIVLDSGSSDSTKDIALEFNASFFVYKQNPPFLITEQRNYALHHCGINSDWVIFIDADEEIGTDLRNFILEYALSSSKHDAFNMAPRFLFLGKWLKRTQGYPNWHPRLLKHNCNSFSGGVWESFTNTDRVGYINIPYEHYAFSKGIDDWISRHLRYATWEAESLNRYLSTGSATSFQTQRRNFSRILASKLWPIRPFLRFFEKYVLHLGFLEGYQALIYSSLMAVYELIIIIKYIEISFRQKGQSL